MPPKVKTTKDDIVKAAVQLVRESGEQSINARAIASYLNCSTQPVFSNFQSMEELRLATVSFAHKIYLEFLDAEAARGDYPKYKSFGMAYIKFAKEEKELFKLLFMRDRSGEQMELTADVTASVEYIMKNCGVSKDAAFKMHLEIWSCVHGIAVMTATSFLSLDWDLISDILSDVYQGVRLRIAKENRDGCN